MSTVDVLINGAMVPIGESALPPGLSFPSAASAQAAQLQIVTLSPTTGLASLADDNTPLQIAAGFVDPDQLSSTSTTAGAATMRTTERWMTAGSPSTISLDGFTGASVGTPWWIADGNTPGALSHTSTKNRSLGGLVIGTVGYGSTIPRLAGGPVYQAIARGVLMASAFPMAWFTIADAAASTAIAERAIPRAKLHGAVLDVSFVGAVVAADNTDYVTITIAKRGLSDAYAAATTIATYDSRAANQGAITAFTPAAFALSAVAGALNLLETDVVTIVTAKGGSGKALTGEFLVNGKVI